MDIIKSIQPSRRGFLYTLGGIFSGLALGRPKAIGAAQKNTKDFLKGVERDVLGASKPTRDSDMLSEEQDDGIILYKKRRSRMMRVCSINATGKAIWEACNGKNTPKAISKLIQKKYLVAPRQAHTDCLTFLVSLKNRGAIQI